MESRFNYNNFWLGEPLEDMSCLEVDRSRIITIFLLLNQTYLLCNVRSELFPVYSCSLFMFIYGFYFLQQTFIFLFTLPYF